QKASQCFTGGVLSALAIIRVWERISSMKLDICPSLPEFIYHYGAAVCRIREYVPALPWITEQEAFMVPLVEEGLYRFLFQEMLLKQLPKVIIKRLTPSPLPKKGKNKQILPAEPSMLDSKAFKVARVSLVFLVFGLAHAMHPGYGLP